jgi:hypothetical protein
MAAAGAVTAGLVALSVGSAGAAPSNPKNAFSFPATCDGQTVMLVINNSNGQGSGSQNNTTASFAPAHVVGSNQVFHPQVFDNLMFTITFDGMTQSFTMNQSINNPKTPVTCMIDTTQSEGPGATVTLEGTVLGFFS